MILGFPYNGIKTIVLLSTIVLIVCQMVSEDFFNLNMTIGGTSQVKQTVGLYKSKAEMPNQNGDGVNKQVIRNDAMCNIPFNPDDDEEATTLSDCNFLFYNQIIQTIILTLLVLGLIPKYGEAAALGGGTILAIYCGVTFYKMHEKAKDVRKLIKTDTPLSTSEEDCIEVGPGVNFCIKKEFGYGFYFTVLAMIWAFVILGINGYGIFAMFMCN
jgi:hypothetical protein